MIQNGLILTGNQAELLSNALSKVKKKAYEESEVELDDDQALHTLVSGFRNAEKEEPARDHALYTNVLSKRLVLGTLVGRPNGAERE